MDNYGAGHRKRLRDKYSLSSGSLVYDYEILELLLTYSIPRKDVKPIAKELIKHFGSIDNVLNASIRQLKTVGGIGENTAVLISLIKEINLRAERCKVKNEIYLGNYMDALKYFKSLLSKEPVEKFALACLDNSNRIIACHILANGDVNHIDINPRVIVENVLLDNASRIIIAHNHPGGKAQPSANDINFTLKIRNTMLDLGVDLSDHIIIGEKESLSMRNSYHFAKFFYKDDSVVNE
ncbi:MAG: DNA repair protein RadC [Clostridiales bacterium]|nr:DNA repair protein RadC [Clostridiales bacterium]